MRERGRKNNVRRGKREKMVMGYEQRRSHGGVVREETQSLKDTSHM